MTPDSSSAKVEPSALLGNVISFGNYMTFTISKVERAKSSADTLDAMMERARQLCLPAKKVVKTRKDGVYNQIIDILTAKHLG